MNVGTLKSEKRGLGSIPGQVNMLCFWAKHSTFILSLSTLKMSTGELSGKADETLGGGGEVILRWANYNIPFKG